MVQFINRNPVTATMDANTARDIQQQTAVNSLLDSRDRRLTAANQDRAGRAIAQIYAEPQMTQSAEGPPIDSMRAAAPVLASEPTSSRSALTAVTGDPYSDRTRRAIGVAAGMEGGGQIAMQLAGGLQQRQDRAHADAIKAFGQGDFEFAKALNQKYGLGLDGAFTNPSAMQVSRALARSIDHLKLEPSQAIAYMDAAAQKFSETRDMNAAGVAGMAAARGARPKGTEFLESQKGYFDPAASEYLTDASGEPVMPPARRLEFDPYRGRGTASGGDYSKGAKFDIDQEGNRVILYRDGTMIYPKDTAGNPVKIKAGTNEDQKFVRNLVAAAEKGRISMGDEDTVARARALAEQTGGRPQPLPHGLPDGARQIGTSGGKPVYQAPNGKRYIVD